MPIFSPFTRQPKIMAHMTILSWFVCACSTTKGMVIFMENRVAVMSIIVESSEAVEQINALLHEYGDYIIGRMGLPYKKRNINIISIAIDAPQNEISALSGKIGKLPCVSVKTAYSAVCDNE